MLIKRLLIGTLLLFLIVLPSFSEEEKEEKFGREDPFMPLIPWDVPREEKITEFSLRAVFLDDEDPRAILEKGEKSYIVKRGDTLGGKRVREIEEDRVVLGEGKRRYIIELGKEPAKSE
jgi:type II secretory pathway component PulC